MKTQLLVLPLLALLTTALGAQVHYFDDNRPWKNRAQRGPDAEVEGWFYNLGITGLRVQLMKDRPKHLLVQHVFEGSPAHRKLRKGDVIMGVNGKLFRNEHRNGYGMEVFGGHGPIMDFGTALERAQTKKGKGKLELMVERGQERDTIALKIPTRYGGFSKTFPTGCKKSERIREELLEELCRQQRDDGSWPGQVTNLFAPLALLASGKQQHLARVRRNVEWHARTTSVTDDSWLINWRYCAAGIVMSEWYLRTKERWVLKELREVYRFLIGTQYMDPQQIAEKTKKDRPQDLPKTAEGKIGGWGHNPGFEGYGPICMITGQASLAFALMKHCGVGVSRERHEAAYQFCARGTGRNGYVWYEDSVANDKNWADMGRTGAAGLANAVSPWQGKEYRERLLKHARIIGEHPESFPDTHGSPLMGMGMAAACARWDERSFRRLMDANRWWFTLAHCHDRTYYYQPNRDNAGYGNDARLKATATVAFLLHLDAPRLHLSGKPLPKAR